MKKQFIPSIISFIFVLMPFLAQKSIAQSATVSIDPSISHAIKGKLNLERTKYFNLSAGSDNFESKVNDKTRSDYYYKDLGMSFGRNLGMVYSQNKWGNSLREDADRPGFMDVEYLKSKLNPTDGSASTEFRNHFSNQSGVAMHDRYGAWPDWLDQFYDPRSDENHKLPNNTDAAAEMAFNILKFAYTDWTRPVTYEILNEPHWAYYSNQKYADLHTKVKALVDADGLDVEIGGPCLSVGYFYKNNFGSLNSITGFIDNTHCDLDFYSFHVYDYLKWDDSKNDIVGRISTGLPIDGVLDAVNNYTHKKYNKEVKFVFSEHGGYISSDQENTLNTIANKYFPGEEDFDWEMKKRSISNFNLVNSSIANTMAFMNHPHSVIKAVPFILLESFGWNPKYYSSLLVADNFTDKNNWVESPLIYFYKYFSEVSGRRIESYCDDPDLQHHAFVNGNTMYLLFHNQSNEDEPLNIAMDYNNPIERIRLRKVGRNEDFTPYYKESEIESLEGLSVKKRESIVLIIDFEQVIREKKLVNEIPFYANTYANTFSESASYTVDIPEPDKVQYAILRVSVGRPSSNNHDATIIFNNTTLPLHNEDCADRLDDGSEYGSLKIVRIDTALLKASNTIQVTFSDGKTTGVGSVVIRAAYQSEEKVETLTFNDNTMSLYVEEKKSPAISILPATAGDKELSWYSLDESIASVDNDGLVKGIAVGSTKIVATSVQSSASDTLTIVVSELKLSSFVNKSKWLAIDADSEGEVVSMPKQNAVDDDPSTYWHTEWIDNKDPLPHYIVVDMQEETSFSTFHYLPRQDQWGPNGAVGDFELFLSNDTSNWGSPIYTGTMNWPENPSKEDYLLEQSIDLQGTYTGRYFKFVGLSEHQNNPEIPFTAAAEFYASSQGTAIHLPDTLRIKLGEKSTLQALIEPHLSPANTSILSWKSKNTAIANVKEGLVSSTSIGTTHIICSTTGNVYADTCVVIVEPIAVTGISLSASSYQLFIDNTRELTVQIAPSNATNKQVLWYSDNETIASVDSAGKIVAHAIGNANIIAITENGGYSDTCQIAVIPIPVSSIILSIHSIDLQIGATTVLGASVFPLDADNKTYFWTSSHPEIAKVENGIVSGISIGEADIIVETEDGAFTDTCKITVKGIDNALSNVESPQLYIYPNPVTNGHLYINTKQHFDFTIIDMSGKRLLHGTSGQGVINVSELKQGIYFIQIKTESAQSILKFSVS